ncbi:3-deoxy-D-manno-octulosonatecytidylyltransferase [Desulfarculus baarsii DSM 2075]|uniref:3-deoxy-manno-octulosonate cytidylyltransferase n=1 Tax=Desulfarculus baarsii (strain ATCC 33931 / DSM 2075 / LMG 7858 / VKM B-1802 / 2st14) TaxID=644282 RepID=E1QEP4_DESB2|nr:3-deoxy-manno-octulosonate cytidylyltransferase [Desulfarculus baarsii]ADK84030.1 3-deoxy-D-manno-octulosonatecytidylyltransferase [Desulfarculus baarsii DSM 2075]
MALHVVIPARYGSSRFPGKPLVDIGGKPMIQRVMERVAQAKGVQTVAVATDDQRIAQAVSAFGGRVVLTDRPMRTGSDRVAHAAAELGLGPDELVVNVQGDQPLLPPQLIDELSAVMLADADVLMATPVTPIRRPEEIADPNHVKAVMDVRGDALYFSRLAIPHPRDGGQVTFYKHLGVYIFRKGFLDIFAGLADGVLEEAEKLEQLRVLEHGYKLRCVISQFDSPEVDRPADAQRVAALLAGA